MGVHYMRRAREGFHQYELSPTEAYIRHYRNLWLDSELHLKGWAGYPFAHTLTPIRNTNLPTNLDFIATSAIKCVLARTNDFITGKTDHLSINCGKNVSMASDTSVS